MNIMVIGSGGREHALAWKLAQSDKVDVVFVAPGNGGTALEAKCRNVELPNADPTRAEGQKVLAAFAKSEGVDLVVIGPEAPLAAGIVDVFRDAGLRTLGADRRAAQLEASKAYSKDFMRRHGVRGAQSETYTDLDSALAACRRHFSTNKEKAPVNQDVPPPLVIKADGLAAGKGVVVAENLSQAEATLRSFMVDGSLGDSGLKVVLEEFLSGVEVSILAAVSVRPGCENPVIECFIPSRDHKRRYEGGKGPNTGGMGAIAPVPDFDESAMVDFRSSILSPTLTGLIDEGYDYRGFIFFGLMVDKGRCSLLEYNVRLGDPETQAVLPLLRSDFYDFCQAIINNELHRYPPIWDSGAVCAPVLVADGYPGEYRRGDQIAVDRALLEASGAKLFVAGAKLDKADDAPSLCTTGGRVAAVSVLAESADKAFERAYAAIDGIAFQGLSYRRDIGYEKD